MDPLNPTTIELTLNGTPNQMAFIHMDTLYLVHNANSLADACHAIADKEGVKPGYYAPFEALLIAQQRKLHKYKWLKKRGYRRISAASLGELDGLIMKHHGLEP